MPDPAPGGPSVDGRTPVAIITGASKGLGLALAREFAAGGHALLLVARSQGELDEAAEGIRRDFAVGVETLAADLTAADGCAAVEEAVGEKGRYGDFLVNNAGTGYCGDFSGTEPELLTALVDLNVRALTDLSRRFLPGMIARNRGGILNVASLAAFLPGPYQAAYYASKAYVLSLSESLAGEVAGSRVRVAALAPGPIRTALLDKMGAERCRYVRFQGLMNAEQVAHIGYTNFMCGQKVIVPGAMNLATAAAVRYLPHMLLTPFTGWLLKPEDELLDA